MMNCVRLNDSCSEDGISNTSSHSARQDPVPLYLEYPSAQVTHSPVFDSQEIQFGPPIPCEQGRQDVVPMLNEDPVEQRVHLEDEEEDNP